MTTLKDFDFALLYSNAMAAGQSAAFNHKPTPMVVTQHRDLLDDSSPVVHHDVIPDGVCGFAWVTIKPATTPFARWLKANGYARPGYGGGLQISIHTYNQSMEKKLAHAEAMAKVLREGGINAYADSRLD